jgi:hypothetical protein
MKRQTLLLTAAAIMFAGGAFASQQVPPVAGARVSSVPARCDSHTKLPDGFICQNGETVRKIWWPQLPT